ncbi:MAG: bacteriocin fulvocin C-related protein [Moheibacter sp.]
MRNLFLKQAGLLFGILILVSSCSSDDISAEQLKITENFDYQKFYEDYKGEIQNLDREEFAGLNVNLRILAYQDFSKEKKHEWWNDKLDETLKINSLTEEQLNLIKKVKAYFSIDFFDKSKNESMKNEVLKLVETNASIIGLTNEMIHNIFMDLNNLDENLQMTNNSQRFELATIKSVKAIGLKNTEIIIGYSKPNDPISTGNDCTNYGCFFAVQQAIVIVPQAVT